MLYRDRSILSRVFLISIFIPLLCAPYTGWAKEAENTGNCQTALATIDKVSEEILSKTALGERTFKPESQNYSLDPNTMNDLKVLTRLYPQLNKTRTYFGAQRLSWLLQNPYLDVAEIRERQEAAKAIIADPALRKNLGETLDRLRSVADLTFANYFSGLKKPFSPSRKMSILSGILSGAAAFMGITQGIRIVGTMIMPMMMFNGQSFQVINAERGRLQDFKFILREGDRLAKLLPSSGSKALTDIKRALEAIEDSSHADSPSMARQSLKRLLGPKNPFGVLADFLYGQGDWSLPSTHKKIIADRRQLAMLLSAIGELDTFVAMADYTSEHPDDLIFPEVIDSETAQLRAEGVHNFFLYTKAPAKSVPNDIKMSNELSLNGKKENGLPNFVTLTGANTGGKSTYAVAVALSTISGQAGGPVPAKSYVFTPTETLTNIDLSDSLEEGKSFYRAEGIRLAHIANRALKPQKLLIIMDEILLGTNPKDRQALEKQVIQFLAKTGHLTLLATHDIEVTHLAETTPGVFNMKVEEIRDPATGLFQFTFKIVPGVSQTTTAFEVLKAVGVPDEIVNRAYSERYGDEKTPKF